MDVPAILRCARRHAGLSQRELAAVVGVSCSAVAAWESGERRPSLARLEFVLAMTGLALEPCPAPAEPQPALVDHLLLPLTVRLRLALGEHRSPFVPAKGSAWPALLTLATCGVVVLQPPVATAMWVPLPPVDEVMAALHRPRRELPQAAAVVLTVDDDDPPPALVPVPMSGPVHVWVPPPHELLVQGQEPLRAAAAMLDELGPRDAGGRHGPSHRDVDEWDQRRRVAASAQAAHVPWPRPELGGGWRLRQRPESA